MTAPTAPCLAPLAIFCLVHPSNEDCQGRGELSAFSRQLSALSSQLRNEDEATSETLPPHRLRLTAERCQFAHCGSFQSSARILSTYHGLTFRRFDGLTVPSRAEGQAQGPTRPSSPVESLWVERSQAEPSRRAGSPSDATAFGMLRPRACRGELIAGQAQSSLRQRSGSTPSEVEGSRDA